MIPLITNIAVGALFQIPYLCISSLLFCSICFSLGGVATDSAKISFEFWIILCEYTACITFFGIFLAMMTPNAQVGYYVISGCIEDGLGRSVSLVFGICTVNAYQLRPNL